MMEKGTSSDPCFYAWCILFPISIFVYTSLSFSECFSYAFFLHIFRILILIPFFYLPSFLILFGPLLYYPPEAQAGSCCDAILDVLTHRVNSRFGVRQNPSLLNLVFTNATHFVDQIDFLPQVGKSDHATLSFEFLTRWPSP